MATLGQKPATQHVSTEKQTLTGNGGTSYTLQQSVSQAADIEVFVNNTRQEPTVAYTASGNTLTMTGAVNASDSFYVIFQGKAIQTAGLPVDAAITASTITASQSLNVTGHGSFTRGSDTALSLNRETSDGTIVDLQKDGTTVGSIGVADSGDRIYLAGGGLEGVGIDNGANAFVPTSEAGAFKDNHLSLGTSSARFENLYLSGGAYIGGTGSANQFDDYEEGTWTPSFSGLSNTPTYHILTGRYTKVGRFVMVQLSMQSNASPTFSDNNAELQITGLPFAIESVGYVSGVGAVACQSLSFNGSNNSAGTTGQIVSSANTDEQITFKVITSGTSRGNVRNVGATGGFIIETTLCYTAT